MTYVEGLAEVACNCVDQTGHDLAHRAGAEAYRRSGGNVLAGIGWGLLLGVPLALAWAWTRSELGCNGPDALPQATVVPMGELVR